MERIETLVERINNESVTGEIRTEIAELIREQIELHKESLGTWEKTYFALSISSLATNLNAQFQPTEFWLRYCLVSLEKALVPAIERSPESNDPDETVDWITYDLLIEAVESLR